MSTKVLIIQHDDHILTLLEKLFQERGDSVTKTKNKEEALLAATNKQFDFALIDLHLVNNEWEELIVQLKKDFPEIKLICTNNYPVLQREYRAQDLGVTVFLRKEFAIKWIDKALNEFVISEEDNNSAVDPDLPQVRFPVRMKITFPYILLALLLAIGAGYIISRIFLESAEARFKQQLHESGLLAADWIVSEETQLLQSSRQIIFTTGVANAVATNDSELLQNLLLPIAINNQDAAIEILDRNGQSILSLHRDFQRGIADYTISEGESIFTQWPFVQNVLQQQSDSFGNKYSGIVQTSWGNYLYVASPIIDDNNQFMGVALVGSDLNQLTNRMLEDVLAQVTFYDLNGLPIASNFFQSNLPALTFSQQEEIINNKANLSLIRTLDKLSSVEYSEIVGPLEVRNDEVVGFLGAAKNQTVIVEASTFTQLQIFGFATLAFIFIIFVGLFLANRITKPLIKMMNASQQVAKGNLAVNIEQTGDDEVAVLAHSFNQMVSGLREGSMYRDLLGRTVSEEVREQMRKSFTSGELLLEGQDAIATILMSDIRGFTTMSEQYEPTLILAWLNEFFSEIIPVINQYGGVVNKFEGDAVMAFFGILPQKLSAQESAALGCMAAVKILEKINAFNQVRIEQGLPPFIAGIGVHTGPVTAGGLGASDRLHYTVIGDTVNTTARIETFTRQLGSDSAVAVSEASYNALDASSNDFQFQSVGKHIFKGKTTPMQIYQLWPENSTIPDQSVFTSDELVTHSEK